MSFQLSHPCLEGISSLFVCLGVTELYVGSRASMRPPLGLLFFGPSQPRALNCSSYVLPTRPFPILASSPFGPFLAVLCPSDVVAWRGALCPQQLFVGVSWSC